MRTTQSPPRDFTESQLATAASKEPKCSGPLGEGAKRPNGRRALMLRLPLVFMLALIQNEDHTC